MPLNRAGLRLHELFIINSNNKHHSDDVRLATACKARLARDEQAFYRSSMAKEKARFPTPEAQQQRVAPPARAPLQPRAPPQLRAPLQQYDALQQPAPLYEQSDWERAPSHIQQLRDLKAKLSKQKERTVVREGKIDALRKELATTSSDDSSSDASFEASVPPAKQRPVYVRRPSAPSTIAYTQPSVPSAAFQSGHSSGTASLTSLLPKASNARAQSHVPRRRASGIGGTENAPHRELRRLRERHGMPHMRSHMPVLRVA